MDGSVGYIHGWICWLHSWMDLLVAFMDGSVGCIYGWICWLHSWMDLLVAFMDGSVGCIHGWICWLHPWLDLLIAFMDGAIGCDQGGDGTNPHEDGVRQKCRGGGREMHAGEGNERNDLLRIGLNISTTRKKLPH